MKRWNIADIDAAQANAAAKALHISPLAAKTMLARGFTTEGIQQFLHPADEDNTLFDPYLLIDMDSAVERIRRALDNGERIAVYGDYDCDGITATVLLFSYFESLGADVIRYIPDRDIEGYGMNCGAVERLSRQGVNLIVTVDNGISAIEEIELASSLGMDVVVTDHHTPRETLPKAAAVVDPHRKDCPSPVKSLAGVGVAFKLVSALEDSDGTEMLDYYGELVALGTVADVVELTGENRTLVRWGLERISNTDNAGITALLEASGLEGRVLDSGTIAFGLAPRINAAGRLGEVENAVELLLTDNHDYAQELAAMVEDANRRRKEIEQAILRDIAAALTADPSLLRRRLLILKGAGWHHGVIGIAAAKLVERYGKPCLLLSEEAGEVRGSARSVEGFSIIEALMACGEHLTRYGGHPMAAGVSLLPDNVPAFAAAMEAYAAQRFDLMPEDRLHIDALLEETDLTVPSVQGLELLKPYGCGNEEPLFGLSGAVLEGITPLSAGKHLRLRLRKGKTAYNTVYFGMTPERFPYKTGEALDAAVRLSCDSYRGEERLNIRIQDIRPAGLQEDGLFTGRQIYDKYLRGEPFPVQMRDLAVPRREDIAVVYRYIRSAGPYTGQLDLLYCRLGSREVNYCKMRLALDVLAELGLIVCRKEGISCLAGAHKTDLSRSAILKRLAAV